MEVSMKRHGRIEQYIVIPFNCFYCQYYQFRESGAVCLKDCHVITDLVTCEAIKKAIAIRILRRSYGRKKDELCFAHRLH